MIASNPISHLIQTNVNGKLEQKQKSGKKENKLKILPQS